MLRPSSIKGQLSFVSLMTTGVALLIVAVVFVAYDVLDARRALVDSLRMQASLIGKNCVVALSFDNRRDAAEVLDALRVSPSILGATVYTQEGRVFAAYRRTGEREPVTVTVPPGASHSFDLAGLTLSQPIVHDGVLIGSITIRSDLNELYGSLATFTVTTMIAYGAALVIAYLLLSRLQKNITGPILDLVRVTRDVSVNRDYAVRSPVPAGDELGTLAAGFNEMLSQIQVRDSELDEYRRHLEEKVDLRTAELAHANERLQQELAERKRAEEMLLQSQKMEAVGLLAGGVAHDFNNILTAVIGYGELARMGLGANDASLRYVEEILASAERAAKLTQSLLAFSRKQDLHPKPVEVNLIVEHVCGLLRRMVGEDVAVTLNLAKERIVVIADSSQIDQVLMNLATNARDAMPHGGTLHIETRTVELDGVYLKEHPYIQPGPYAQIAVSDTGVGMSDETARRIFEPFFTTKELGRGTGLGMSIVYGIVKQHGGYIHVYSEPKQGTTFNVYLPLSGERAMHRPAAHPAAPARGTEVVLLAEDDAVIRRLMRSVLEGAGYTVIEAVDGADAVDKIRAERDRIQMLLLDVIMPKKNGRQVYDEARQVLPGVRTLFISGYTADIIQQKGIISQEEEVLSKPVTPGRVLEKVREVLDR